MLSKLLSSWSKPATGKDDPQVQDSQVQKPPVQGKADPAEPSADLDSVNRPPSILPNSARKITFDTPDRSVEVVACIVNNLALDGPSRSSSRPPISGKRKRHEAKAVDESTKKRVAKESRATGSGDEPPATSTNTVTGQEGRSNRASSETVKETPRKLPRPRQEQRKRHMTQTHRAVQKEADPFVFSPTPEQQVENPAASQTTPTKNAPSSGAAPRRRGRPRRVETSRTTEKTSSNKGQRKAKQNLPAKSRAGERIEGSASSVAESREGHQSPSESSAQKAHPKASRAKTGADSRAGARESKSIISTIATNRRRRSPQPGDEEGE